MDTTTTADIEMTPEQEYDLLSTEWYKVLSGLWVAIGKEVDPARLEIYGKALADVKLGLLEKAIERVLRENTYSNVPPVGTIWQAVRRELGNPHDLAYALENWHPDFPAGYRAANGKWEPIFE